MDSARWRRAREVFDKAVSLAGDDREQYLNEACKDDPELEEMLDGLLEKDQALADSWERELASIVDAGASAELNAEHGIPAEDVGAYHFLRFLGQGGMGTVYQAEHRTTGQLVAIKALRVGELSAASRERFATEQRALARLNHPLIARLYASENFRDGTPCFVMEYVEGERLTTYCHDRKSSIGDRILLFRQVCQAVQHAHEHAIIHRDLKPSNILVKSDGSVRLLDFGIAKELDGNSVTGSQPSPMTIKYAAPEQLTGDPVGTHTDVYALGVILYELLTGRTPHDLTGLTPGAAETAILEGTPDRPSRVMKQASSITGQELRGTDWSDLDVLCGTAIHKDPARRYRSVEALIRDLDHWLARERLDARQDSFWYRASKFARRNNRALSVAVIILLVAMTATVWFTWSLARARDQAVRERDRTQRVEQFVFSLFGDGDSESGPSKNTTALTILDRGRKEADAFKNDPDLQADLYEVLGNLYLGIGQFDQSDHLLAAALKLRNQRNNGGVNTAASMIALGFLRANQSRFPEAEKLVGQGLAMLRKNPAASKQDIAAAESKLGEVLMTAEKFQGARPLLEDALRIQTQPGGSENDAAKTLDSLGSVEHEAGKFSEAIALDERALKINNRVYGNFHPRVAENLESIGNALFMQARYADADRNYRKALDIYEGWYGMEHPKTAEILIILGQALLNEGQYDQAREMLMKGAEIGSRVLGEKSDKMEFAFNALGTLEQKLGHFDAARIDFDQAIKQARVVYGNESYIAGLTISNLATLEWKAGHYHRAEELCREALKYVSANLPADHPELAKLRMNLGKVLFDEHQYQESEEELQAALAVLSKHPEIPKRILEKARADLSAARSHLNK